MSIEYEPLALPPGRWVRRGNILVYAADPMPPEPEDSGTACGTKHGRLIGLKLHVQAHEPFCDDCLEYNRATNQRYRDRAAAKARDTDKKAA